MLATGFATLPDLIRAHALERGDRTAVADAQGSIDYRTLDRMMDRVAVALRRDGVAPGTAVAIVAAPTTDYAAVFLGAVRAGCVATPIAPSATRAAIAAMIADSGAPIVFLDAENARTLEGQLLMARVVLFPREGGGPDWAPAFAGEQAFQAFEDWLAPDGAKPTPVTISPEDPFNIIYSSGTTGTPKGIVHFHRDLMAVADEMASRSLSYNGALQDLGTLLHRIALAQSVPSAVPQDLPELNDILRLAQAFDAQEVQLYYQIAVHGRNEIGLAPDEYAGFTMTLLRMLAFRPGFALSYDIWLTALSLMIAVLVCGAGIAMASRGTGFLDRFLGGAVVGIAISTMHYTGMAALIMGGRLVWDPALVSTSIMAGIVLGGLALAIGIEGSVRRVLGGALVLTLAICAMHFTAMGAADFSLCFPLIANGELNGFWLSIALTFISILLLGLALGSTVLDEADRRRTARERERELRDAAQISAVTQNLELAMTHMAQGLGLYGADGNLQLYNQRFPALLDIDPNLPLDGISFRQTCRLSLIGRGMPPDDIEQRIETAEAAHLPLIEKGGEIVVTFAEDRVLQVSHNPIGDGSWVTTIDDITERHRSQRAIANLARHDGLTGLPNRARFNESFDLILEKAIETGAKIAVIAIDLDHFKEINDSHGHAAGDVVLKTLAGRFNALLREGEVIARLGGDEFAAIMPDITTHAEPEALAQAIIDTLSRPIGLAAGQASIGVSIGIATAPDQAHGETELLRFADDALYRAKNGGRNRYGLYGADAQTEPARRQAQLQEAFAARRTRG